MSRILNLRLIHAMHALTSMIAFIPNECDVDDLLGLLNDVEPAIQPTVEEEREGKLPFLDMVMEIPAKFKIISVSQAHKQSVAFVIR